MSNGEYSVSCPNDVDEELEILKTRQFSDVVPYDAVLVLEQ